MSGKKGVRRVIRGGSYFDVSDSWGLRSTYRNWCVPEVRSGIVGFLIVIKRKR